MLRISIEGDDAQVMGLLYALGAHAHHALGASQQPALTPEKPVATTESVAWAAGREVAQRVVKAWQEDWERPQDEQPDRQHILSKLIGSPASLRDLTLFLSVTDDPWVYAGATVHQAAHIAQVGSALQILPAF